MVSTAWVTSSMVAIAEDNIVGSPFLAICDINGILVVSVDAILKPCTPSSSSKSALSSSYGVLRKIMFFYHNI